MLFAFGGLGTQEGMVGQPSAFSYKGNDMIVLDTAYGRIVTYKLTDYGQTIFRAIELNSKRKFTEAAVEWENVLRQNNNNHLAYAAMGQSYLTAGEYEKAMTCFKAYGDVKNYSLAFAGARKNIMRIVSLPLVIVLAAVVVLLFKLAGKIKKINKAPVTGKRTVWNQVLYAHHVIFHPFDGFYDIKREGRGSVLSATVILAFTVITFMVKNITTGFIFGGSADSSGITGAALTVLLPFFLWCAANWCLTTLMDGEGKFSHIYMATAYSLVPVALCNIPIILLSNFLTLEEGAIISFIFAASMLWMAFLVFAATITIHRYTLGKNILMILLTVVGIGVILFLGLLFANVIQKMLMFIVNIYTEISFRLQEL